MIKTLLVELTGSQTDTATLQTAYLAARLFDARLECLHLSPEWQQVAAQTAMADMTGPVVSEEFFAAFEAEAKAMTWRAHRHFLEFCKHRDIAISDAASASVTHAVSAAWQERLGEFRHDIAKAARFHDLTVISRRRDIDAVGSVILKAGRPILLAPEAAPENFAPTIAVAWKDRAESARAMTAAMPLLEKAEKILLVCVEDGEGKARTIESANHVAEQLRWHGLSAEVQYAIPGGESIANTIVKCARDNKADLIVSGAYGHSRVSELVLGGVTRDLLKECPLPLFLFH
ncbi:MAG TPA: universal stress protein [Micropepsaceae bacterium]|nr:universal stress protein [Micropepsaceae bacterium]